MDEVMRAKLTSALEECRIHARRLRKASDTVREFFPLNTVSIEALDDDQVAHVDQFIYRFMKLQDTLGQRLFPVLHGILEDDFSSKPFIDVLNRLEKLEYLPSVAEWQFFRELRNRFSHEYPERTEEAVLALNELFMNSPRFIQHYEAIREKAERLL